MPAVSQLVNQTVSNCAEKWKMRTYRRAGACSRRENGGWLTKLFPSVQNVKNP